jgi:peptide/nickel transport system substrate-binding protein
MREGITRRRFMRGAAAGAGAAFLIACGSDGGNSSLRDAGDPREPGSVWFAANDWKLPDESRDAVRGGIFRHYAQEDLPGHLDPIPQVNSAVPTADHTYQLLMARNRGPGVEPGSEAYNNPVGALAETWETSVDGLSVTFTMQPGVRFHNVAPVNGRVMDIDDWKSSHDRHMVQGTYRTALASILDKVDYPDDRRMVWKLKAPYAPMVDRIWDSTFGYFILPKELNADPSLAEQRAIGTGFKILDRYEPSIGIQYRKHPEYWGGDPFIDRWHEPIIPEYSNQYSQFVQGNVTNFAPTARDVMLLRKDAPGAVIVAAAISETQVCYHRWGKNDPLGMAWKDERVRVAMRRSIDWTGIAHFLSNKPEFDANGIPIEFRMMTHVQQNPSWWLNPESGEHGEYSQNFLYSPDEAKKLTAAAGYAQPINLPFYVNTTGDIPSESQVVIDSLKTAGAFNVEVKQVPPNEYRVNINIDGKYDGTQLQTCASGSDVDYVLFRDWHSSNLTGIPFPDPHMDRLAEAQRYATDPQERNAILKEIQIYQAQKFYTNPGRSLYTTFSFRWPWLHNSGYAANLGSSPDLGGHLHWLDPDMPNRNRAI